MQMIDLTNFNERTLFIIGNGFDIAHNIKSSYSDFHDWLLRNRYEEFVLYLEKLFPSLNEGHPLLWKDFEKAIGIYDSKDIHVRFFQGIDNGFYDKETQVRVTERITPYVDMIPKRLIEWARNMEGITCKRKFKGLTNECLYLTFNYTLTLENCYCIPRGNICHIHGCIEDESIIVGHNIRRNPLQEYDNLDNIEQSRRNIVELMNKNEKPVKEIIKKKMDFFNSLNNIKRIIVVGHSLAQVDMPYFIEVTNHINRSCIWHFCWHDPKEESKFKEIIHSSPFSQFVCQTHKI